jgi:hypothetical protein
MKAWVVVGILALVAIFLLLIFPIGPEVVSGSDARAFVLEDLWSKYPNADNISILSMVEQAPNRTGMGKYYTIKARVTTGLISPCPERRHVYYNYPEQGFVKQPDEIITQDCMVCINAPVCILAFEEEAIIASHTYNGTEGIGKYINAYPDAVPAAEFRDEFEGDIDVWVVEWDSNSADYSYFVALSSGENRVLSTWREEKQSD